MRAKRGGIGVLVSMLLLGAAPVGAEIQVRQLTDAGINRDPSLREGKVAWVGWDGDSAEIRIANLRNPVVVIETLTDDGGEKEHVSTSGGGRIVWQGRGLHGSDWEIYVYDPYAIPRWRPLTDNDVPDRYPSLGGGGNIAWLSGPDFHEAVHYWNESAHHESVISDACCPTTMFANEPPSAHGSDVFWRAVDRGSLDRHFVFWDGVAHALTIPDGSDPSLYDGTAAYVGLGGASGTSRVLFFWDGVDAGPVTDGSHEEFAPSLDAGRIAYEVWDGHDWEIFYWDGVQAIQITDNAYADTQPTLDGDLLAWVGRPDGLDQIFYAEGLPEPDVAAQLLASALALAALASRRRGRSGTR